MRIVLTLVRILLHIHYCPCLHAVHIHQTWWYLMAGTVLVLKDSPFFFGVFSPLDFAALISGMDVSISICIPPMTSDLPKCLSH